MRDLLNFKLNQLCHQLGIQTPIDSYFMRKALLNHENSFRTPEEAMQDYGARYYSAREARWLSVDPLAEKYFSMSPYNYVAGNPIKYIDPKGMWDDGDDGYGDGNGNYVWFDNQHSDTFTDDGTTWNKVTDNKEEWDDAIIIREAEIDFLANSGYEEQNLRQEIQLLPTSRILIHL